MLIPAAIAGGSLLASYLANKSAADRENDLNDAAFREFLSIHIPDPEKQKLALQRYVSEGELTPELEQAIKQNESEFSKIVVDQNNKSAQARSLAALEDIGNQGGMTLTDKANLQKLMMKGQVDDRAQRLAISDQMARRGQAGSGFDLQARLAAQQASGDRNSMAALSVAGDARDRALKAIMGSGELATKYRGQDFEEQAARAKAQDAINEFNARNLQNVMNQNVALRNRAQEMNLKNKRDISNENVELGNKEQQYNRSLAQQQFENQMNLAKSKAGQYNNQAGAAQRQGQAMSNMFGRVGSGAMSLYGAYGSGGQDETQDQLKKRKFSMIDDYGVA